MTKQIFRRMQVNEQEQAEITKRLAEEFGGDSFSNVARKMWGFDELSLSKSLKGNKNKLGKTKEETK